MQHRLARLSLAASAASLLFAAAPLTQAHEAGDFIVRAGVVGAKLTSETISYTDSDTVGGVAITDSMHLKKNDVQAGMNLTYMVTEHLGVEFMMTSQFSHKVTETLTIGSVTGSVRVGKITQLPLSLNAVYYPMDKQSAFQPYVGAGINYTFADVKLNQGWNDARVDLGLDPVTKSEVKQAAGIKNRFGFNVALGVDYNLTKNWLLNANVRYVRTPGNKAGDDEGLHMAKGTVYYMAGIGYKF